MAKKIFSASLVPNMTMKMEGNYCEYEWIEKNEEEYGEQWNGDVQGYVENLDGFGDEFEIKDFNDIGIHRKPQGAIIVGNSNPTMIFWAEEIG